MAFLQILIGITFLNNLYGQVIINNRTQCKEKRCDGDNFCFQGYCTPCDGPRNIWMKRKPQWGVRVGEALGVEAFSNYGDANILDSEKDEYLSSDDPVIEYNEDKSPIYIGQKYQCVHYARYFWISKFTTTFASIDSAADIFNLQEAYNFLLKTNMNLLKFDNGAIDQPQLGDLLIWQKDDDEFPHGHVAVVLNSEVQSDYPHVLIAEQNYDQTWDTRNFARALKIIIDEKGGITVTNQRQSFPTKDDLKCRDSNSTSSAVILGWVRLQR